MRADILSAFIGQFRMATRHTVVHVTESGQ